MHTAIQAKAQATKLREILGGMGHTLKHSQCLEALSRVEGFSDWNSHTAQISNNQQRAEKFLSEILEAEAEVNYAKFMQRWEKIYHVAYPEHRFLRHCRNDAEELGKYVRREFLGCAVPHEHPDGLYPNRVKYIWQSHYEHDEAILALSIYSKGGTHFICSYGVER